MTPDPHAAWSAYCLVDQHNLCEQPTECGCDCHHIAVDDDHTWGAGDKEGQP